MSAAIWPHIWTFSEICNNMMQSAVLGSDVTIWRSSQMRSLTIHIVAYVIMEGIPRVSLRADRATFIWIHFFFLEIIFIWKFTLRKYSTLLAYRGHHYNPRLSLLLLLQLLLLSPLLLLLLPLLQLRHISSVCKSNCFKKHEPGRNNLHEPPLRKTPRLYFAVVRLQDYISSTSSVLYTCNS